MPQKDELKELKEVWPITEHTVFQLVPDGVMEYEITLRNESKQYVSDETERIELCKEAVVGGILYIFGYGFKSNTLCFRRVRPVKV